MKKKRPSQSGFFNPRVLLGFVLGSIGVLLARVSVADFSRPGNTFVTNGNVQAVVRSGDTIYIGGLFNRVGPRTGPGVQLALDGSQIAGLPEVSGGDGTLQTVASDGSGGWYIGGLFTHVGGVARNNIAHIRADHSVDPAFDPNANDGIHALAVSGSTVYAAGLFTSIGGQTRNRIAGLNAANGTATAFNPNADAGIEALAISDSGSIIYAGGRFAMIGGQPRDAIAALNAADGSATTTFNPMPNNRLVLALAISGSTLYVGGYFTAIGGQPRNNIAALNASDGMATSFDPNATTNGCNACGGVSAIVVSSSTVYAGGLFTHIGGQNRRYCAALNAADGTATAFNPNPNGNILGLAVSVDGLRVYAAGGFNSIDGLPSIGGQVRNYLAALNAADGTATTFNPNPNNAAIAIGVSASAVYAGGSFTSLGGVVRHSIAALNATDGTATSFDPNAGFGAGSSATVYALAVSGSTVYAGGYFHSVGGQPRNYIAALNAADGTATSWNPGASDIVQTLAVSGSIIYAGGDFTLIGGQPRNFIAALNAADGSPTAFNPNANSLVQAIAVSGPLVYVGGFFTSIGGQTRNKIAALSADDGSATSWNPDATAAANVLALAVSGSTIYAGGDFVTIGGQARQNIAALNASDGMATSFDPHASDGVFALALSSSTVYAAGFFSTIGGQTRNLVAELNPTDGTATSFDPGADPGFGAFALTVAPDGTLYVGGSFRTFELASQQGFAAFFYPTPTPTPTPIPTPTPTPTPTISPTPTVSPTPTPTPSTTPTTLGNISTRLRVETGDNVLIGGFIVTETQSKKVILRAIGPSLPVTGALANPILELRDSAGGLIRANDNWRSDQETEIIATGIPPSSDLESAIVAILPANSSAYTATVRGVDNGTGVGLVEVYDLDRTVDSKLANISTRGFVQTGENVLIGGFIVLGQNPLRVIVRAIGPSLPVSGALGNPTLELHDGSGTLIASNDDWRSDQENEIIATGIPPSNDFESAIVRNLTPGIYTAIVSGVNGTTGVALVEAYALN